MNKQELIGKKFGKLTVISFAYVKNGNSHYFCKCDCGKNTTTQRCNLLSGHAKTCGCSRKSHGMTKTRFYVVWRGIKSRCLNRNKKSYGLYGGRGINISQSWLTFDNFQKDMYKTYVEHRKHNNSTTIERINNNGNYCKENCRWATIKEQSNNRRNNHLITYNKTTMNIKQWSEKLNINYTTLKARINKYKWSVNKSFTTKLK